MKRIFLFLLCLLFAVGSILGLTACDTQTDPHMAEPGSIPDDHEFADDLPAVQESDAAYLLDPEFTVTPENFADCVEDYFSAPAVIHYYFRPLHYFESRRIKNEKAAEFAAPFRDLTLTDSGFSSFEDLPDSGVDLDFHNAIGSINLYEHQGTTYISFPCSDTFFCVQDVNLVFELTQIAVSLEAYAEDIPHETEGE